MYNGTKMCANVRVCVHACVGVSVSLSIQTKSGVEIFALCVFTVNN